MDSYEDYRKKLREAADYAFYYGAATFGIDRIKANMATTWDKDMRDEFAVLCHDGFKKAQKSIIEQILNYQTELRQNTSDLKDFRRQSNKPKVKAIEAKIAIIEQRIHNFLHIADGIAWQMLSGQIHIARRLSLQEKRFKFLDSSNLSHAITIAEQINQTPLHFALLTDITSYIHIGDLLVKKDNILSIVELKEGIANKSIGDFLKQQDIAIDGVSEKALKEQFDEKTVAQAKRIQRQVKRGKQAVEVINTDKGTDPATGLQISITTPTIYTEFYHGELRQLFVDLNSQIWAYAVVEDCIHIGMYRDNGIFMTRAIKDIMEVITTNYIVIDWLMITRNLSAPIFMKPFPPEFIIDIMTGKIKVMMGLDLDRLIDLFNSLGLTTRWMTKKETAKIIQTGDARSTVVVDKRALCYKLGDHEVSMGWGIISKLMYDCILPSNIALSILSARDDEELDKRQTETM